MIAQIKELKVSKYNRNRKIIEIIKLICDNITYTKYKKC